MGSPAAGSVVLVRFPFSDLTQTKLRPAVVLAVTRRSDFILCQISSRSHNSTTDIRLTDSDFESGSLQRISFAIPDKLFTASQHLVVRPVGMLADKTRQHLVDAVCAVICGA